MLIKLCFKTSQLMMERICFGIKDRRLFHVFAFESWLWVLKIQMQIHINKYFIGLSQMTCDAPVTGNTDSARCCLWTDWSIQGRVAARGRNQKKHLFHLVFTELQIFWCANAICCQFTLLNCPYCHSCSMAALIGPPGLRRSSAGGLPPGSCRLS